MSASTRMHGQPLWNRIKAIASSRTHRAMKRQHMGMDAAVCPEVQKWIESVSDGDLSLGRLQARLGQLHTDYINALDQTQEKLIKTRIRQREAERKLNAVKVECAKIVDQIPQYAGVNSEGLPIDYDASRAEWVLVAVLDIIQKGK